MVNSLFDFNKNLVKKEKIEIQIEYEKILYDIIKEDNFINININENQFDEFDNLKKVTFTKGNLME